MSRKHRRGRLRAIIGGAGVLAIALVALVIVRGRPDGPPSPFPPPAGASGNTVSFDDFLGADACAECHTAIAQVWQASTHGRAGGEATDDLLLSPFDGTPIRFADAIVIPRTEPDGRRAFVVARENGTEQTFMVDGVVGGGHMLGGGTQGYLTSYEDGTLRFLPFERIRLEDTWFCNTDTRLDRGWLPITDRMRLADCGDWPPVRVFGNLPRFANCQECHGSQIEIAPSPERPSNTRLRSLSIDCEACHGPGRTHVEALRSDSAGADIGMTALATLSKDESVAVCMRCHALKDGLGQDWLAGREFDESYSVMLPLISNADIFADGRTRTFAYQQGHLWSDCFISGSMTCVDCHDPHAQNYRDSNYEPLGSPFDDGQCISCHPSKAVDTARHTHHSPSSTGSRCVSCHMPYIQQPDVGDALRYARSDHTIPVPRPAADEALGIRNACQTCHTDRDAASLERQATEWWGSLKPRPPGVDALLRVQAGDTGALDDALDAVSTGRHRPALAMALGLLVTGRLRPGMPDLDDATNGHLRAAASSDDPDIAALGLAGLHLARGDQDATRRLLTDRLASLGDMERAVRSRWTIILGSVADNLRATDQLADAIAVYGKALEIDPDNAAVLLRRGLALAAAGDTRSAEADYLRSIQLDSLDTLPWVNLGIARAAQGDGAGAIAAYRSASRIDPRDPMPWFNMGNVYLRANRYVDAIDAYRRAVEFAPGLAAAHFNLARALIAADRLDEAGDALRAGLEFEPGNEAARQTIARIDSIAGSSDQL
jgi:tetratricopeptide (TPR) repeat protein